MRTKFVSLLVLPVTLSASLAVAQNSQPQTLQAAVTMPATGLHAAPHAETKSNSAVRVTTGVSQPKLLAPLDVKLSSVEMWDAASGSQKVAVVSLTVDEKGLPHDMQVVKSAGANVDSKVVAALGAARFQPASLDNQAVAVPMTLSVVLK